MNIFFKEIDKTNYEACVLLKVSEGQKRFVASNAYSLVQAAYEDNLYPLAIYDDDEMIGFILYDYDEELKGWSFSRFMIDIKHQNKGYGTKALEKFLAFFHEKYPSQCIYTSAENDNAVAIRLYEQLGFEQKNTFSYTVGDVTYTEIRMQKTKWE